MNMWMAVYPQIHTDETRIAGTDPLGFRVSDSWNEGDFTCTIINEMLKDGRVHGPFWGQLPVSVCAPTLFRSFPGARPTDHQLKGIVQEIALHRQHMNWKAVSLVEHCCDDYIVERLVEVAVIDSAYNHSVAAVVCNRLERCFLRTVEDPLKKRIFEGIVQRHINAVPTDIRNCCVHVGTDALNVNWAVWLSTYRLAFTELEREIGFPT